jgi:hypothetical protein
MGKMRSELNILARKPNGKPLRIPRHRWEDNIRIDLRKRK